jgi:hypothetical protein
VETSTGTWIAAAISATGIVVSVVLYLLQRRRLRLEYIVTTNAALLPDNVANELEVRRGGVVVDEPALCITRVVNTGDKPVRAEDFETGLVVAFEGVEQVVSATWSASRPRDLEPPIEIDGNRVVIEPRVINPGDMLELQVLSAGWPRGVSLAGRVAGLELVRRKALPYPPGSGSEGQIEGFDRFVWFGFMPAGIFLAGLAFATRDGIDGVERWLTALATVVVLGLYLLLLRFLVRRRRLWRPY